MLRWKVVLLKIASELHLAVHQKGDADHQNHHARWAGPPCKADSANALTSTLRAPRHSDASRDKVFVSDTVDPRSRSSKTPTTGRWTIEAFTPSASTLEKSKDQIHAVRYRRPWSTLSSSSTSTTSSSIGRISFL